MVVQNHSGACFIANFTSLPHLGGGCEVLFWPCLSVCISVCVCVWCVSGQYFGIFFIYRILEDLRRDVDLKIIQDTYRVVLNLQKIDIHMSKVKVTGTVHFFLKVVISQKLRHFIFFHRHLLGYYIRWNNKNLSEQRNDITKTYVNIWL